MGEHLPCKQGVKSSNLSVSIAKKTLCNMYLENRIQKTKNIFFEREIYLKLKYSTRDRKLCKEEYKKIRHPRKTNHIWKHM